MRGFKAGVVAVALAVALGVLSLAPSSAGATSSISVSATTVDVPAGMVIVTPKMAADGNTVAFIALPEGDTGFNGGDLYIWRRGQGSTLVDDFHKPTDLHMSADGSKLAYVAGGSDREFVIHDVASGTTDVVETARVNGRVMGFSADGSAIIYGLLNDVARYRDLNTGVFVDYPEYRNDDVWLSGDGNYIFFEEPDGDRQTRRFRRNMVTGRVLPLGTDDTECVESDTGGKTCYPPSLPQTSLDGQRLMRLADRGTNLTGTSIIWKDIVSGISHSRPFEFSVISSDVPPTMNKNGTVIFGGTKEFQGDDFRFMPTRWDPVSDTTLAIDGNGFIYESNAAGDIGLAQTSDGFQVWVMIGPPAPVPRGFQWMNARSIRDLTLSPDFKPAQADVLRLYWAFFNRDPDLNGTKYWLAVNNAGFNLDAIADNFVLSSEFDNTYGATTNREFLEVVYLNVLGRTFDQGGFDYWLGLLDGGQLSRGGIVRWVAANGEFIDRHPYPE